MFSSIASSKEGLWSTWEFTWNNHLQAGWSITCVISRYSWRRLRNNKEQLYRSRKKNEPLTHLMHLKPKLREISRTSKKTKTATQFYQINMERAKLLKTRKKRLQWPNTTGLKKSHRSSTTRMLEKQTYTTKCSLINDKIHPKLESTMQILKILFVIFTFIHIKCRKIQPHVFMF